MADVSTAEKLINVGYIVTMVVGAVEVFLLLISVVGLPLVPIPIIFMWYTHKKTKEAEDFIRARQYYRAKDALIVPSVLALIFVSRIGGLIELIGALLLPSEDSQAGRKESAVIQ